MQGFLTAVSPQRAEIVELPKETTTLNTRLWRIEAAASIELLRQFPTFAWTSRLATWTVVPPSGDRQVRVNGEVVRDPWPLANRDLVESGGVGMLFSKRVAAATYRGLSVDEISLTNQQTVIGRRDPADEAENCKVVLDAECTDISRSQVIIVRGKSGYTVTDASAGGTTLLNGKTFATERLVFGDRIRVADYAFLFTGTALRVLESALQGAVSARSLTVRVGRSGREILSGTDFDARSGQFVGILGGSGQGKSTLLKALCGIIPVIGGEVRIGGVVLDDLKKGSSMSLGYVPQDDVVHRELKVVDALSFSAKLRLAIPAREIQALVSQTLNRLSLEEHREKSVHSLSGGQRKRVSIAIELLAKPSVLFLDEPSSGLDPATEGDLMELLQELSLSGMTVVCTTHVLQKAYLFNRLLWVHQGRLIFDGSASDARQFFLRAGSADASAAVLYSPLEAIYSMVVKSPKSAVDWQAEFAASEIGMKGRIDREKSEWIGESDSTSKPQRVSSPPYWTQLGLLLKRQGRILTADWLNLAFLMAQALVIGAVIGWVAHTTPLRSFLGVIAIFWLGCSNAAQQIVAELPIVRRETLAGVGLTVYFHSKVVFFGAMVILQACIFTCGEIVSLHFFHPIKSKREQILQDPRVMSRPKEDIEPISGPGAQHFANQTELSNDLGLGHYPWWNEILLPVAYWFGLEDNILESKAFLLRSSSTGRILRDENGQPKRWEGLGVGEVVGSALAFRMLGTVLAGLVGVMVGLLCSVWARTTTQAVMCVPLLLIPQILMAGAVVTLPEMLRSARMLSTIIPCAAAQRILEVGELYGRMVPAMSNETKMPLFIDGSTETVSWIDEVGEQKENYPSVSGANASWQNQIVAAGRVGQRKIDKEEVDGARRPKSEVRERADIKPEFHQGIVFMTTSPIENGALTLGAWMGLSYIGAICGLRFRLKEL